MSPEFIIQIIVRARNEMAGVMDRAAASVDKVTKAQDRTVASTAKVTKEQEKTKKSINDLQLAYAGFVKEVEKGNKTQEDATFQLKRFQQEFDRLARRSPVGSQAAEDLNRAARSSQKLLDQIVAAEKERARQVDHAYKQAAEVEAAYQQLDRRRVDSERQGVANRQKLVQDLVDHVRGAEATKGNITDDGARRTVASEQEAIDRRKKFVSDLLDHVRDADRQRERSATKLSDFEVKEAARIESVRATSRVDRDRIGIRSIGRDAELADSKVGRFLGSLHGLSLVSPDKLERMQAAVADFDKGLGKGSYTAIRFAGTLRSLVYVGAFVFFQELTGAAVALGGALVAIASAAVQAGAALGGMAVAAASQAIPVIGLLGAAWGRVGAIFKAVQQNLKNQAQASFDAAQAADRQRTAAEGVRSAQEALTAANLAASDAQDALNKAREDGVRQLEDLVAAERKAQLQAESAALAQRDAQQAFGASLRTGDVGSLAKGALDARSADLGVTDAQTSLFRAHADRLKAGGSVENLDSVIAAEKAVAQAGKGVADAAHALGIARDNAAQTIQQISTADRLLKQMLDQLSPAERRLYGAINRLYQRYKDVFIGDRNRTGILGSIIDAFTHGADRVRALLGDQRLIDAARKLSRSIGAQLRRAFDGLTSPGSVSFVEQMADQARKNLPIVVSTFGHLLSIIKNIAKAASPALTAFLTFLDDLASKGDRATSSKSGLRSLERFFSKGEKYAESIIKLTGAIAGLFLAIIGTSAQQGQNAIDTITSKVQEATAWINGHKDEVRQFFTDAVRASGAIAEAIGALAKALFGLFQEDHVTAFADAFKNTLLPILSLLATEVGALTQVFLAFAGTGPGSAIVKTLLSIALLSKVFGVFGGTLIRLGREFALFFGRERMVGIFNAMLKVLGPTRVIVAAIVTLVALANGKLPSMHDVLKLIAGVLAGMLITIYGGRGLKAGLGAVLTGLERLGGASLLSRLAPLGRFFSGMLGNVRNLISRIPILGRLIGGVKSPTTTAGPTVLPGAAGRPTVVVPAGARRVPIEPRSPGGVILPRGVTTGAAATGGAAAAKFGASKVPIFAAIIAFVDYLSSKGTAIQRVQSVLSDFTFGIVPKPNIKPEVKVPGPSQSAAAVAKVGALGVDNPGAWIQTLISQGNIKGLHDFQANLRLAADAEREVGKNDLAKQFDTMADKAGKAAENTGALQVAFSNLHRFGKVSLKAVQSQVDTTALRFKAMRDFTKGNLDDIASVVRRRMRQIKDDMGTQSSAARFVLADNFERAIDAVKDSLHRGVIGARDAMKAIRGYVTQELSAYGIDFKKAQRIARQGYTGDDAFRVAGRGNTSALTRAVGGFVGNAGERGRDLVHTVLGRGEAVLNAAHQRVVEPAMRAAYGFGLGGMFKRVRGEHAGGGVGMAAGGSAGGGDLYDGHPSNVATAVTNLIRVMKKRFPLTVGSTTDHDYLTTTGNVSDHSSGHAVDLGGTPSVMFKAAEWIKSSGLYRRLKQGIHNPNLAVNAGKILTPPGIFAGRTWTEHINHLHLAITGAIGKLVGGVTGALKRTRVNAPGSGIFGVVAQGGADLVSAAANRLYQKATADSATSDTPSKAQGADVDVVAAFKRAIRSSRAGRLIQLALFEAGIVESGLKNLSYGDRDSVGALQQRPSQGWTGLRNPFRAALEFIAHAMAKLPWRGTAGQLAQAVQVSQFPARYDAVSHQAQQYLARGGQVLGRVGQAVPIVAHAGEWVVNKLQQSKLAGVAGTSVQTLKGMLGFSGGRGSYAGGGDVKPYTEPTDVGSAPSDLLKELTRANRIIGRLRTGVINSKFTDALSTTFATLLGDGGLFDQLNDSVTKLVDQLSTSLGNTIFKIDKAGNVVKVLDDQAVADKTVANLREVFQALRRQEESIVNELALVAERLSDPRITHGEKTYLQSVQKNLTTRLGDVRKTVGDNLSQTYQAVEDSIQAVVDAAQKRFDRSTFMSGIQERMRSALGAGASDALGLPDPNQVAQVRASALRQQADDVARAADAARRAGHNDTYRSLIEAYVDIQARIVETIKSGLEATVAQIESEGQRRQGRIDLRGRVADVRERLGDVSGAFAQRGQNLLDTRDNTRIQIGQLQYQQAIAAQFGQAQAFQDIGDKIAELDTQLAENALAIQENTIATRSAAIDAITSRSGFLSSVASGLGGIVSGLGQLTGVTDVGAQRTILTGERAQLTTAGGGLAEQLLAYGIDVRGMSPAQIVAKLSSTDLAGIEQGLIPADRQVFEGLVNSVISNTGALVDNSNALSQLDGSMGQAFTSTAWQLFRTAIFNGAGGLLPQFRLAVPGAASGALIRRGGLLEVHTGERVVAADLVRDGRGGDEHIHMHLTTPVEVFDPTDAARQLAFHRKIGGP